MKPPVPARPRASPATLKAVETDPAETSTSTELTVIPAEETPATTTLATVIPAAPIPAIKGIKSMADVTQTLVTFSKQNLEAVTSATKIWTAGIQDLTAQFTSTAKANVEESMAAFKALTSVKSVKEAIDLQSTYSKNMVAKTLAETGRLTDASLKLTEQTLAPITARVAATVEVFSKAA